MPHSHPPRQPQPHLHISHTHPRGGLCYSLHHTSHNCHLSSHDINAWNCPEVMIIIKLFFFQRAVHLQMNKEEIKTLRSALFLFIFYGVSGQYLKQSGSYVSNNIYVRFLVERQ